jgi:hypothetical protein
MLDEPVAPDLAIGSFTDRGPWVVDPDAMPWRADVARHDISVAPTRAAAVSFS